MKRTTLPNLVAAIACFVLAPIAIAQPNNSMLYQPNVDLRSLSQNGFTGVVGGVFYTPYFYNANVNYLGYADPGNVPLLDSHTVTVWSSGGGVVASAVVPSGAPTLWANGYAWVPIPTVTLTYQSFYTIGATVTGGVDSWGDAINNSSPDPGNNGQITWNVVNGVWGGDPNSPFVQAGSGWEGYRAGRYGSGPGEPGNQIGADSMYPAPNLGYNLVGVPEPTSLALLGMGTTVLVGILRRQRK